MMLATGSAFASMVDYVTNNSPEYLKNPAGRNAATNSADTAANNPAGTIGMGDGFFVNASSQIIIKTYAVEDQTGGEYESYKTDPVVPNLYMVYNPKGQDWNIWSHVGVLGGGGSLIFPEGGGVGNRMILGAMAEGDRQAALGYHGAGMDDVKTPFSKLSYNEITGGMSLDPTLTPASGAAYAAYLMPMVGGPLQMYNFDVVQSSVQICQSLGSSYAITKDLTVAAGIRFVESKKKNVINYATGGAAKEKLVDLELTAWGVGGIMSVNYKVLPNLNLALTYESVTKLEYQVDSKLDGTTPEGALSAGLTSGLGYEDGKKFNLDMPHRVIFGAQYGVTKDFLVSFSFHGVFRTGGVEMEKGTNNSDMITVEKFAYEIGTGFDWQITDRINWGLGVTYDCINANEEYFTESDFKPDLFITGTGFSIKVNDRLTANVAVSQLFFFDTKNDKAKAYDSTNPFAQNLKFTKTGTSIGLGLQYKFL